MINEIENRKIEIAKLFNEKPSSGTKLIEEICDKNNVDFKDQIADFFIAQRNNLDLVAVGDYLGTKENKAVLEIFADKQNFDNKPFLESLRTYLNTFKLPGEGQKIDMLIDGFATTYSKQNPNLDTIDGKDAALILAYQVVMLNTGLHNPNIDPSQKMTPDGLTRNLKGQNNESDFNPKLLEEIYSDIKNKPLELNFQKIKPNIEIDSNKIDFNNNGIKDLLSDNTKGISGFIKNAVNNITGSRNEIIKGDAQEGKITITVIQPNIFSRVLSGIKPFIKIEAFCDKDSSGNLKEPSPQSLQRMSMAVLEYKLPIKSVNTNYEYMRDEVKQKIDERMNIKPNVEAADVQHAPQEKEKVSKALDNLTNKKTNIEAADLKPISKEEKAAIAAITDSINEKPKTESRTNIRIGAHRDGGVSL